MGDDCFQGYDCRFLGWFLTPAVSETLWELARLLIRGVA